MTIITSAAGQVRISIMGLAGSYAMSDMHDLQDEFVQQTRSGGFSVNATEQFPTTPQIEIGVDFQTSKRGYWGSFFNFAATRGVAGYGSLPWLVQRQQNLTRYLLGVKRYRQILENFYLFTKRIL